MLLNGTKHKNLFLCGFSCFHNCGMPKFELKIKMRLIAQPYLDMLSGEQAELFPVETLVSMLSELSRLRVS